MGDKKVVFIYYMYIMELYFLLLKGEIDFDMVCYFKVNVMFVGDMFGKVLEF